MEFIDQFYQFILYLIKTIKGLVVSLKGEEVETEPTIVDETN